MEKRGLEKQFLKYVLLNVLGMVGLSCYILADTFFVARGVGELGLAALNLAIPVYSFIHGTGLMIGMGGAIRFSISGTKSVFLQSCYLVLMAAVVFVTAGIFFSGPLAALLGADTDTRSMAEAYIRTILCFAPMFLANNLLICFVRNDGNPKLAMAAMLTGSFSNIVLDYVLVFPFQMGMFGAALATGIAPIISLLVLSVHFRKGRPSFWPGLALPRIRELLDICRLGVFSLVTEFSAGIVIIVFNTLILGIQGNLGVAAYGILANIALVVNSIFTGISQGIQPLVSARHGAGDTAAVKRLLRYGIGTAAAFSVLLYLGTVLGAWPLVGAFNREGNPVLSQIAVDGLRIYFLSFLFAGANIVKAACFSAVDRAGTSLLISVLRGLALVIPAALLLSRFFGMTGVWLSVPVTELMVWLLVLIAGKRRKEKEMPV